MPVLIGGAPSTGSSLLRQMLNRHSAIYCGPETQFFAHPQLFTKWDNAKQRLVRKPLLTSPDIHLIRGVNAIGDEQGWDQVDIAALIDESGDFKKFCESYFSRPISLYGNQIWMDKTPSNVLSFKAFLDNWNDSNVVHIVRDPLDIVASLMQRGHSLFVAASRYLFNTAHALVCKDNAHYFMLRYESLVSTPVVALEPLLGMMKLKFESGMLEKGNPHMAEAHQMPGWRSSEIESPNKRSVGRFESLTEKVQEDIITCLNILRINPDYAQKHGLTHLDSLTIAQSLGYAIPESNNDTKRAVTKRLRAELRRYRQNCLRERRLFYEREKPVVLARN